MESMKEHKAFVLVGETGSGKTTQVQHTYLEEKQKENLQISLVCASTSTFDN